MAQVRTEAFSKVISDKLFAGAEFINQSVSHDAFASDYQVHVPQAGTIPAVQEDRAVLPATIGQRTDSELTYDLIEFTNDPMLIKNIEKIQLSYPKIESLLSHQIRKLTNAPSSQFEPTTTRLTCSPIFPWIGDQ